MEGSIIKKYAIMKGKYLSEGEVVNRIKAAIEKGKPFSMVRIGDGECYILGQDQVFPVDWIRENIYWFNDPFYCGTTIPNLEARDRCLQAVRNADLIGVFTGQEVPQAIFSAYKIPADNIFYAFLNVGLPMYRPFVELIKKYPPLLVGRPAAGFAELLSEKLGIEVPYLDCVQSYQDVDNCIEMMARIPHRWSLISAGINALIISDHMAREYGKVAVDFGHAPDMVLDNENYWLAEV